MNVFIDTPSYLCQQRRRPLRRHRGQAGRRPDADIGPGMQPQQREQPGRIAAARFPGRSSIGLMEPITVTSEPGLQIRRTVWSSAT